LFEVAITAPGADSTNGIACEVVFPDRGAITATTVSSHDAYTTGPVTARRPGRINRPSASPACAGSISRGSWPLSDRRSPTAARAAAWWVSARIRGFLASAATGSPAGGRRRPIARPVTAASTAAPAISTTAMTATATVGVCGQARQVRPCRTSAMNFSPNGSAVPPVIQAATLAAAQSSQPAVASAQQPASASHAPAVPPEASGGRGPSVRLTAASRPALPAGQRARLCRPDDQASRACWFPQRRSRPRRSLPAGR